MFCFASKNFDHMRIHEKIAHHWKIAQTLFNIHLNLIKVREARRQGILIPNRRFLRTESLYFGVLYTCNKLTISFLWCPKRPQKFLSMLIKVNYRYDKWATNLYTVART